MPAGVSLEEFTRKEPDATGDAYEDFPDDQLKEGEEWKGVDIAKVADELKGMGNKAFKSGDLKLGLSKYQKGLRYLQEYPATIEGDPAELGPQLQKLRISLHTNSALLQYKLKQFDDATRSADYALAIEGISDVEKAKALFRKGVVAKEQKNEEDATKFLEENPEVVKRILLATAQAVEFVNDSPDEAQAIVNAEIEKFTTKAVGEELLKAAWSNLVFTVDPIASSLQASADDAIALGLLEDPGDLSSLENPSSLASIRSALG